FWDRAIDYTHLKLYKVERAVDLLMKIILLLIALAGISSLVSSFYLINFGFFCILAGFAIKYYLYAWNFLW
ncbi:MAG: hypothetical protein NTX82_07200, partial [Candidatus Parcubacteria bacterium]|nr:hypothetical protein [Candidatus Parcubacteria bacterium]